MGVVAVMRKSGLRIVRQSLTSMQSFGDIRGEAWRDAARRHASAEAFTVCRAAVEEACDTGAVARVHIWSPLPAEFTARSIDDGLVLTTWRPLTHDERIESFIARWPSLAGDR